jgi:hypothetical protein
MSSAQYLVRRTSGIYVRRTSGIYFVRLYMPARLKAAVGKGEIHRTTGCRDYRLAKIVAAELAAHWHRSIQAVTIRRQSRGLSNVSRSKRLNGDAYAAPTLGPP